MPTTPITLLPVGAPLPYTVVKGHLVHLYTGAWVLDVELSADSIQQFGMPSGRCVVTFGGVPMSGTIDPTASGTFGPTAMARVVAGGNGWSTSPPAQDWHLDNGVLSTIVYEAIGAAVQEIVVDMVPTVLGVDVVYNGDDPASSVFRDNPWFVDVTGTTYVGQRLPSIPDPSLVIRDWDPIHQKATFSCSSLLIPNTPLVDPRFNGNLCTAWNVEQVFDGNGSIGWAWATQVTAASALAPTVPATSIISDLKAAVLQWTRASYLRTYRYRLVLYMGDGPGGGPERMALQAVAPSAGMPDILPIAPWSGVAGIVSELAPSQEVLVTFENADPTLPRVIGYSLVSGTGQALGLPLKTTIDALAELDVGVTAPIVTLGAQALAVDIAGGADYVALSTPVTEFLTAMQTWSAAVAAALSSAGFPIASAQTALVAAIGTAVSSTPAVKTKAT